MVGWCVACTLGEVCRRHQEIECATDGCGNRAWSGRYCSTCYQHRRREDGPRAYGLKGCLKCKCPRHYARGLCRRCYRARSAIPQRS